MAMRWLTIAFVLAPVLACSKTPEPMTPSLSDPAGAAIDPQSAAPPPSASASGEQPEEHRRHRKPFSIHSSCPDIATLVFGEDAKATGAGRRTIASNSSIDGPRDPEGKQTVWLLDDKGEPLVKVHITRGMKTLEVGRSCRTLDAR